MLWRALVVSLACVASASTAQTLLLDTGFPKGSGPSSYVRSIVVQPDGRILVSGSFTNFNDTATGPLVRLHPDGALDTSFSPGPFTDESGSASVSRVALLTDGRILVTGPFTHVGGLARTNLAVLRADGRVDPEFVLPTLLPRTATFGSAYPADHGGVWVTGSFTNIGGLNSTRLARLDVRGSPDPGFHSPFTSPTASLTGLVPQPDGKLLVNGTPLSVGGSEVPGHVVRLNPDGSLDENFALVEPAGTTRVSRLTLGPDGGIVAEVSTEPSGLFTDAPRSLVRWLANGQIDAAFAPDFTYSGSFLQAYTRILGVWPQPDGRWLVAGTFLEVNGIARLGLARLNPDGSTDLCFEPGLGPESFVITIATAPDGQVLVGGTFRTFEGNNRPYLARLHPESVCGAGALSFSSMIYRANAQSPSALVTVVRAGPVDRSEAAAVVVTDGTTAETNLVRFAAGERAQAIAIPLATRSQINSGDLISLKLQATNPEVRIASPSLATLVVVPETNFVSAGRVDTNFVTALDGPVLAGTPTRRGGWLFAVAHMDASGYVIAASDVRQLAGDGTRQPGFGRTNQFEGTIAVVREMADGSILVGGDFRNVQGRFQPGLARLLANSELDLTYAPLVSLGETNFGAYASVSDLSLQPDGSVICSGSFPLDERGTVRRRLARITAAGGFDREFGRDSEGVSSAAALLPLPDGSMIVGLSGASISLGRFLADGTRDSRFIPPAYTPLLAQTMALLSDQTFLAGGATFPSIGIIQPGLARLAPNGGEVTHFGRNAARWIDLENSSVSQVRVQSDGRVLVAGALKLGQADSLTTVVRLHADGSWDPGFNAGIGAIPRQRPLQSGPEDIAPELRYLEPLADGGLLVAGDFAGFGDFHQPFLVKLQPPNHSAPAGVQLSQRSWTVRESAGQASLALVRSGDASASAALVVRTVPGGAIAGLDFTPVLETITFAPGEWLKTISVPIRDNSLAQTNRTFKVEVTGPSNGIELGEINSTVVTIEDDDVNIEFVTADIVANEDAQYVQILLRRFGAASGPLNVTVVPDERIAPSTVAFTEMTSAGALTNTVRLSIPDDALAQGDLTTTLRLRIDGPATPGLKATAILHLIDNDFPQSPGRGVAGVINDIIPSREGGVYLGGDFVAVHGIQRRHLARLRPDGDVDPGFNPREGPNGLVRALALDAEDGLLVAGDFYAIGGAIRRHLGRLLPDGALDPDFNPGAGPTREVSTYDSIGPTVLCLALLPDQRLLVGGNFSSFGGHSSPAAARLLPDGRPDTTFRSVVGPYLTSGLSTAVELHVLEENQVLAIGDFSWFANRAFPRPAQTASAIVFDADGAIDSTVRSASFDPVTAAAVLPDGTWVIGGIQSPSPRTGSGSNNWLRIERFKPDRTSDTNFVPRSLPGLDISASIIRKIVPQSDGGILFLADAATRALSRAGGWSLVGRLRPDGEWDPQFAIVIAANEGFQGIPARFPFNDPGVTATNSMTTGVATLATQLDGVIVVGGGFKEINGELRQSLARLEPNGELRGRLALKLSRGSGAELDLLSTAEVPVPYWLEHSADFRQWSVLLTNTTPWRPVHIALPPPPPDAREFFRLELIQR